MTPAAYQQYLDDLMSWARTRPDVLGVVGLGSTAGTAHQPDEHSDHDIFVVTAPGAAAPLRDDLSWLPESGRIVMVYAETVHGRGVVYDDGHLVELAVFDDAELELARVNSYRVFVDRGGLSDRLVAMAAREDSAPPDPDGTRRFHEWVVQVVAGVGRAARGEQLSANERLRGRAMSDLVGLLSAFVPAEQPAVLDSLDSHRRFEHAYPHLGARLAAALESPLHRTAEVMVDVVEEHLLGRVEAVTPAVIRAVRAVIERVDRPDPSGQQS